MENYTVIQVTREKVSDTDCFVIRMRRPDGQDHVHFLPQMAIAARAAEYDIDHTEDQGRSDILHMLIHEPFMDEKTPNEVHVWNAPTRAHAREAHLARVEHTRVNKVSVDWDHETTKVMREHRPHPDLVKNLREQVLGIRRRMGLETGANPSNTSRHAGRLKKLPANPSSAIRAKNIARDGNAG